MKSRYAVVKFVPDAVRFEPINIGLVFDEDGRLTTRMAEDVDPRIRLADPYADLQSLRAFLATFDASTYEPSDDRDPLTWLHQTGMPNIYFSAPFGIETGRTSAQDMIGTLFKRLVARNFSRPPELARVPGVSAARSALREAFRSTGILGKKIETQVPIRGLSGVEWQVDFRYVTNESIHLVEAATTGLHEDIRRKEHGYEAFTTLIDTTRRQLSSDEPAVPTKGTLAVDASVEESELSAQLSRMAAAHGFRYVAGQRAFYSLAEELVGSALSVNDRAGVPGPQQRELIGRR
jgi:hypothetical protein